MPPRRLAVAIFLDASAWIRPPGALPEILSVPEEKLIIQKLNAARCNQFLK